MVFLAYRGVGFVLSALFSVVGHSTKPFLDFFCYHLTLLLALFWIFWLLTRVLEEKTLGSVGLAFCGCWKREMSIGLGLGASMIFLVAGLERLLGLVRFARNTDPPGQVLSAGLFFCWLLLIAATNEELIFRGYPFQRLVEALGSVGAVAVSSIVFGLVHLGNPSHTWISTANTMLVGIPLAVAYLRTRALWLPIGMHFAWNFIQGYGLGLPVSGMVFPKRFFEADVHGLVWLTGGKYGPEGGLLALGAIAGATAYLCFSKSIYTSEEMKALVFGASQIGEGSAEVIGSLPTSTDQAGIGRLNVD